MSDAPADPPIDLGPTRRIGLIGDVHTEAVLLERAIRELHALGADVVFCVGDIANGRGDLARCCDLLQQWNVVTVRGNRGPRKPAMSEPPGQQEAMDFSGGPR
jgi:predicted phosphodiesterase